MIDGSLVRGRFEFAVFCKSMLLRVFTYKKIKIGNESGGIRKVIWQEEIFYNLIDCTFYIIIIVVLIYKDRG